MLKRKWARASIVLMGSGLTMLLIYLLLGEIVLFVSEVSIRWMISCGITLVLLGGFCHLFTSNCPHCGGIGPKPRWSYWDDEYCPRCGRVYPYDDRPGGPPKGKPEARPPLTLDRKPARRAMLLLAAGLLCLATAGMIPTGFPHRRIWGPDEELRYAKLLLTLSGAGLLLAAWRLCIRKLRCPACHKGGVTPWLKPGAVRYCRSCDTALSFTADRQTPCGSHRPKRETVKAYFQRRRSTIRRGLLVLAAVWCLWYARPLDIYDLMGCEEPAYLSFTVLRQSDLDHPGNLALTAGEPEMDVVLERLAELRFHRNPLEVVLRLFPESTRSVKIDLEKDYRIYLYAYDQRENPILYLNFDITDWHRDLRRELPLYLVQGQEKGRELGAFLLELSRTVGPKV